MLGLALVKGYGEHSAFGLYAHVHAFPAQATVGAAEQHANVALKACAGCHPERLGVAWSFRDAPAVGIAFVVEGLEPHRTPVCPLVSAAEHASTGDSKQQSRMPAAHQY